MLIYSCCPETGLLVCEIRKFLLVREDGFIKHTNPLPMSYSRSVRGWHSGSTSARGYKTVTIKTSDGRKSLRVHRLVAESFIPNPGNKEQVDHINRVKDDNQSRNLRWATNRENSLNQGIHQVEGHLPGCTHNPSACKTKPWQSKIQINGKSISLGYFTTQQEAHNAYVEYKRVNNII